MSEPEPPLGAREQIGRALDGKLDAEQVRILMDEVLKITKQGRGWCPTCGKHVMVQVQDAKAVTGALTDLANQAWGRPSEVRSGEGELVVNRNVYVVEEQPA